MVMKSLKMILLPYFKKEWSIFFIFIIVGVFFWRILLGQVPLPADALVGAHIPWTEKEWAGYPAGVPIKNLEISDSISQFYPWRSLVAQYWRNGKAPLWNQYMFNGTPFVATLHSAALYPLNFLYLFLSDINTWTTIIILQILLSTSFMYLFLRDIKLGKSAAYIGAIGFGFSGYMIAWLEFATGGQAGIWLPLLLIIERKLINKLELIYVFLSAVIFYFVFTAGDFQVPLYISATYALYGIFVIKNEHNKLFLKRYLYVTSGLIFGIIFALPQLLPVFELFPRSIRSTDPYITEYFYGLMDYQKITNFIWPDFYGNVVTRNYWSRFGFHEYMSYGGIIGFVLVVFSFLTKKHDYNERFFQILLISSLILLFPTPVSLLLYKLHIPIYSTSSASRIIYLVDFCLAILAGYGMHKLSKNNYWEKFKNIIAKFLVLSLIIFGALIIFYKINPEYINYKTAYRNMILGIGLTSLLTSLIFLKNLVGKNLVVIGIILLTSFDMLRFGWKNTPFSDSEHVFPETEIINYLKDNTNNYRVSGGISTNYPMVYQINSSEGYDPIYPMINGKWYSALDFGNLDYPARRYGLIHKYESKLLDYASVKYVVDYPKNKFGAVDEKGEYAKGIINERFDPVFKEGRVSIFENKNVYPKVWVSDDYESAHNYQNVIDLLNQSSEQKLVLLKKADIDQDEKSLDYKIISYDQNLNEININVISNKQSLLFMAETYYPGWKAYINDNETEIFQANYLFQAVKLPQGESKVIFKYRPNSYFYGQIIAVMGVMLLGVGIIFDKIRQ